MSAEKEGSTVAKWAEERGFHAGVFAYQVMPVDYKKLLQEINETMDFLNKQENISQIYVCGFSAGAHLVGLFATNDNVSLRPDGIVMCYPVVTLAKKVRHLGSAEEFFAGKMTQKLAENFSIENRVDDATCPAFIWSTFEDNAVPCQNAMLLATAYREHNVPCELHIFPDGEHGLGTQLGPAHTRQWLGLLNNWLDMQVKGAH